MLRTIPSWFRRHFLGTMFWYRESGATCFASGGNRRFQFSNNGGRVRSRDQIIWISFFKFLKFSLPHHISSLVNVFDHSFWKLYIKTINDLDPGLNVPEQAVKEPVGEKSANILQKMQRSVISSTLNMARSFKFLLKQRALLLSDLFLGQNFIIVYWNFHWNLSHLS